MSPGRGGAMLRNRLLILLMLGACFLTASAAWADDVGYVNCSSHPEATQVFAKPRKTPDMLASLPCGERFTVLVYGFIFSRIETRDGKVGYVYSSLISVDPSPASVQQVATARVPVARSNVSTTAAAQQAEPTTFRQPQRTQAQPAPAQAPEPASPEPTSHEPISKVPETTAAAAKPDPAPLAQPQPASDQVSVSAAALPRAPGPVSPESTSPEPVSKVPETAPTAAVPPNPATSAPPEPAPAQPAAPAIRSARTRTSWEKPNPGGPGRPPVGEFFAGLPVARIACRRNSHNFTQRTGSVL